MRRSLAGTVSAITLDYANSTNYSDIVALLSRELGNPTIHDTIPIPDSHALQDELVLWENRTTSLVLWHSNLVAGGFAVRLILSDPRLE